MAQSVFKTFIARYNTILEKQKERIAIFRKYSLRQNQTALPRYSYGKYFDHAKYRFGTAKLVYKHGKYFLHIPVTYEVEESSLADICHVVGIDRGINFVIATYDRSYLFL